MAFDDQNQAYSLQLQDEKFALMVKMVIGGIYPIFLALSNISSLLYQYRYRYLSINPSHKTATYQQHMAYSRYTRARLLSSPISW